jgi:hypothetical protein
MKKLTFVLVLFTTFVFSRCKNYTCCEIGEPTPFTLIVKNHEGEDLLNRKTNGFFDRDSIQMFDASNQLMEIQVYNHSKIDESNPVFYKLIKIKPVEFGANRLIIKWNSTEIDTLDVFTEIEKGVSCPSAFYSKVVYKNQNLSNDKSTFNDAFILVR